MRYIFVMSLAGSILFLSFLFVEKFVGSLITMRDRIFFLKVIIAFFLIPSVFVAELYRRIWLVLKGCLLNFTEMIDRESIYRMDYIIYHASDWVDLSDNLNVLLAGCIIWLFGGCCFFLFDKARARINIRLIRSCSRLSQRQDLLGYVEELRTEYGIRRNVSLYEYPVPISAFTVGTLRPKIFIFTGSNEEALRIMLRHEMIHISRHDIFLKQLTALATYLHWFNPLLFFLRRKMELTIELACDECLIQNASEQSIRQYANLLLETARYESPVRMSNHFSERNNMKERIKFIMNSHCYRSWKRYLVLAIMVFLIFGTSFVSLANPSISNVEVCENGFCEDCAAEDGFANGEAVFLGNGFEVSWTAEAEPEVLMPEQFIAENGTIYAVDRKDPASYLLCSHSFESGIYQLHNKNSSGGCVLTRYRAERCRLCTLVRVYEKLSTYTYDPCPH